MTQDVRSKYVSPALNATAFNCPRCGALAKQFWHSAYAKGLDGNKTPKVRSKPPAILPQSPVVHVAPVVNLFISECYNCDSVGIWIYDRLIFPRKFSAPIPSPDLPDDVRADYEEAGAILDSSPRGAAALLRLGIQKLCKYLGGTGDNINQDIKTLVTKGLDSRVQKALDVVRVVGNHSVHPGKIDLKDDRETAESLFDLVNLIAEIMITQPKHVDRMYNNLPRDDRKAIQKRDRK